MGCREYVHIVSTAAVLFIPALRLQAAQSAVPNPLPAASVGVSASAEELPAGWRSSEDAQPKPDRVPVPPKDTSESPTFRLRHHERAKGKPQPTGAPTPAPTHERRWTLGAGPALDWPASQWNPAYGLGTGLAFEAGYALDRHWFLGAGLETLGYSGQIFGNTLTDQYLNLHLNLRYFLGGEGIRPYLAGLAGGTWQISSAYGQSVENFEPGVALGAGVELGLDEGLFLYGETRVNFILIPGGTAMDIPFITGLGLKL